MAKITFEDKVNVTSNPLPRKNKVVAEDINEIKSAVNELYSVIEYNLDPNGVVGSHDLQIGGNNLKLKSITAETTACSLEVSGVPLSINDTVPAWSVITAVFTANELSVVKFEIL